MKRLFFPLVIAALAVLWLAPSGIETILASSGASDLLTPAPSATPKPLDPANLPTVPGYAKPYAVPGSWRLVMAEEFWGYSLNTRLWQPNWFGETTSSVTQYINSEEGQCFDPGQVRVSNGELDITAINKTCPSTAGASAGFPVTSGMVSSYPRFMFTYGVAEVRMWVAGPDETHCNNWVSFWLNGAPSDSRQEYDVAECRGGQFSFFLNPQNLFGGESTGPIARGWHVFSIDWEPSGATVYYDKTAVGTITQNVYSQPMYVIIENAVQASDRDTNVVPNLLRVDYVRVWQGTPATPTPAPSVTPTLAP